jgi:hypothetical protein
MSKRIAAVRDVANLRPLTWMLRDMTEKMYSGVWANVRLFKSSITTPIVAAMARNELTGCLSR